jgi:hypothetical protein
MPVIPFICRFLTGNDRLQIAQRVQVVWHNQPDQRLDVALVRRGKGLRDFRFAGGFRDVHLPTFGGSRLLNRLP